jgi:hypothetical protein
LQFAIVLMVLCCRRSMMTRVSRILPRVILRDRVRAVLFLHVLLSPWKTLYRYDLAFYVHDLSQSVFGVDVRNSWCDLIGLLEGPPSRRAGQAEGDIISRLVLVRVCRTLQLRSSCDRAR